jgi:hypothetical protein
MRERHETRAGELKPSITRHRHGVLSHTSDDPLWTQSYPSLTPPPRRKGGGSFHSTPSGGFYFLSWVFAETAMPLQ